MNKSLSLLALAFLFVFKSNGQCTVSGTKTIGATGADYTTLASAISALTTNGVNGPVILELQSNYVAEATVALTAIPCVSSTNTITIRPSSSVSSVIAFTSSTTTFSINGGQYYILDGRPGGTGTNKYISIAATTASGIALQLINEASNNTIRYCTIQSANSSTSSGTIYFSTTTGSNGNDNNTIDHCDVKDGASTPTNAIYSSGTTTTTLTNNSDNIISNNNIFNFFSTSSSSTGVLIASGSTAWSVTGNSFYQQASKTAASNSIHSAITISNTSGNGFLITNNYIGGSASNAGGSAWTLGVTGTSIADRFIGISLTAGNTTASSIQGNNISNINFTTGGSYLTTSGNFCGINVGAGLVNIGTNATNTIGNATGTGSITATSQGGISYGICVAGANSTITVANNNIGSINLSSSLTSAGHSFAGIITSSFTNVSIYNNTIGSTITANSINSNTASTSNAVSVTGINNGATANVSISNNLIANLYNSCVPSSTGNTTIVRGIYSNSGTNTISVNTVRNLSCAALCTDTTSGASVIGISLVSTSAGSILTQNTIHSLSNNYNSLSLVTSVTGIYYTGATTGSNIISRNFVHSLNLSTTNTAGKITGINIAGGASTIQNNLIRLGIDADGNSITNGLVIAGIDKTTATNNNFYHNNVYIGGTAVTATANSYAFRRTLAATDNIRNNILVNNRSNSTGSGRHYAIGLNVATSVTSNYNLYYGTGIGFVFGYINTSNYSTLASWKSANATFDVNSLFTDPGYKNAVADYSNVDLHILNTSAADIAGTSISGITDDYDGQTRSALTPTDIGADAVATGVGILWTAGANSSSWNDPGNWNTNSVPTSTDSVVIPQGISPQPVISSVITVQDLNTETGSTLSLSNTVSVTGTVLNNGNISGTGKLLLNGSSAQEITGTGTISNLEIDNSNGVSINSSANQGITGLLSLTSGTFNTNGKLTLKSTSSTNAAMVGPVTGSISGDVIVERFISQPSSGVSTGRSWRMLAVPVKGNSNNSIFYNWQNNGSSNGINGVEIWGPVGTGQAGNGLATGPGYSLKKYDNITNTWTNILNTNNEPLFDATVNNPFLVFCSGSYGSGNIGSGASSTTLKATGALITGTQNYSFTPTSGHDLQLIANPYACPIDFDKLWQNAGSSNIKRKFWVVDPNQNENGGYVSLQYNNISGSYDASVSSSQNQYIQNGQAFFVQSASIAQSTIAIEENDKETAASQTNVFRTNNGSLETMRINLYAVTANNSAGLIDGALINCHQTFSGSINAEEDCGKFSNFHESISVLNVSSKLAIEGRPLFDNGDTVKINLSGMRERNYVLEISPANINAPYLSAILIDNYLNSSTPINLVSNNSYSFSVDANPLSYAANRFILAFNGINPLSVKFINSSARESDVGVEISWNMASEKGSEIYHVERSTDGKDFSEIGKREFQSGADYHFTDINAGEGELYYRIRAQSGNEDLFSRVMFVQRKASAPLSLFPNPVVGDEITLIGIGNSEVYDIEIINTESKTFIKKQIDCGVENKVKVQSLIPGMYQLKISDSNGKVQSLPFIRL
jgi:hypothetical protein